MTAKQRKYDALVVKRKKCRLCRGLLNPSAEKLRQYDSNHIGPWSRLHGDLNAKLMIVGQDWGDVDYYRRNCGLDDLQNPTMRNLERLLFQIGVRVSVTNYSDRDRGLFLTNAVLCLKKGGLQAKLDPNWSANCSTTFLRQQIEIIHPKVVVGLGQTAFQAVLKAFGLPLIGLRQAVLDTEGCHIGNGVRLFAVYHCGARTMNINRNFRQQCRDWKRIQTALQGPERSR